MATAFRTTCATASAFRTRSVRALFLPDAECQGKCGPDDTRNGICPPDEECQAVIFSRCRHRVSRQMSSGRCVPWHLPSGRGVVRALFLLYAECQGKCRPDDTSHNICLIDEECQSIPLRDTARLLQMQSVKANVLRTMHAIASAFQTTRATVSAFWTRSVRAFFLPDAARAVRT